MTFPTSRRPAVSRATTLRQFAACTLLLTWCLSSAACVGPLAIPLGVAAYESLRGSPPPPTTTPRPEDLSRAGTDALTDQVWKYGNELWIRSGLPAAALTKPIPRAGQATDPAAAAPCLSPEILLYDLSGAAIVGEADSFEALCRKTRPAATWNGCDMIWSTPTGLVLDRAYLYQAPGQPSRWVLLRGQEKAAQTGEMFCRASVPFVDALPTTLTCQNHYAFAVFRSPDGQTLYEVGWQTGSADGGWVIGRRLLVLREKQGHFTVIAELPGESAGPIPGGTLSSRISYRLTWTGRPREPINLNLTQTNVYSARSKGVEGAAGRDARPPFQPDLTIRQDGVLSGPTPMDVFTKGRPYCVSEVKDDLNSVAAHLAAWMPAPSAGGGDEKQRRDFWSEQLRRLNPIAAKGTLHPATRIEVLTADEAAAGGPARMASER